MLLEKLINSRADLSHSAGIVFFRHRHSFGLRIAMPRSTARWEGAHFIGDQFAELRPPLGEIEGLDEPGSGSHPSINLVRAEAATVCHDQEGRDFGHDSYGLISGRP